MLKLLFESVRSQTCIWRWNLLVLVQRSREFLCVLCKNWMNETPEQEVKPREDIFCNSGFAFGILLPLKLKDDITVSFETVRLK